MRRRKILPDPPVNIQLHLTDGSVVPAEAVYVGDDEKGVHLWQITTSLARLNLLSQITVTELPAHTGITLHVQESE